MVVSELKKKIISKYLNLNLGTYIRRRYLNLPNNLLKKKMSVWPERLNERALKPPDWCWFLLSDSGGPVGSILKTVNSAW